MYIVKNALRSITRSLSRNILICIIALVIATSACIALSIKQSSATAKDNALKQINVTGVISINEEKLQQQFAPSSSGSSSTQRKNMRTQMSTLESGLSLTNLQKYAKASSVSNFYYQISSSMNGSGIDAVDTNQGNFSTSTSPTSTSSSSSKKSGEFGGENGGGNSNAPKMFAGMGQQGDFTVIGYSTSKAMTDFVSGTKKLSSGSMFTFDGKNNSCIISDQLATYNSLKVGSTITLKNPNKTSGTAETYTFTVTGIYHNSESSTSSSGGMSFGASSNTANQIYTSYTALNNITTTSTKSATTSKDDQGNTTSTALRSQVSGTYVFGTEAAFNTFKKQVKTMGLSDSYTVTSPDITSFENSIKPLDTLGGYATIFLLIVLLVGGVLLALINIFSIRDRKYEVGVLAAIGMKKFKVASQFVVELFIVTFVAIIIGTSVGAAVSVPVTNSLLQNQIAQQTSTASSINNNFGYRGGQGGPGMSSISQASTNTNFVKQVQSATDLNVVMELVGIGILLTLISSSIAIIFISRYEPLKILSNRD